jgi:hypothetical protein
MPAHSASEGAGDRIPLWTEIGVLGDVASSVAAKRTGNELDDQCSQVHGKPPISLYSEWTTAPSQCNSLYLAKVGFIRFRLHHAVDLAWHFVCVRDHNRMAWALGKPAPDITCRRRAQ